MIYSILKQIPAKLSKHERWIAALEVILLPEDSIACVANNDADSKIIATAF